jgi:hypothetical protein
MEITGVELLTLCKSHPILCYGLVSPYLEIPVNFQKPTNHFACYYPMLSLLRKVGFMHELPRSADGGREERVRLKWACLSRNFSRQALALNSICFNG